MKKYRGLAWIAYITVMILAYIFKRPHIMVGTLIGWSLRDLADW